MSDQPEFEPRERVEDDARIKYRECRRRLTEARKAFQDNPTDENADRVKVALLDLGRASTFM